MNPQNGVSNYWVTRGWKTAQAQRAKHYNEFAAMKVIVLIVSWAMVSKRVFCF